MAENTNEERGLSYEERDPSEHDGPLSDDERRRRMQQGIDALLSGLLGIEPPPPQEITAQRELREAVDTDEKHVNCRMATMSITRADGKEVLLTTTFLRETIPIDQMERLESYVNEVVLPVLKSDERVTIHLHDFSPAFFAANATQTLDIHDLKAHMATLRTEAETAARARKFEECEACSDEDCEDRVTERPE